jgi:hypothetical protein
VVADVGTVVVSDDVAVETAVAVPDVVSVVDIEVVAEDVPEDVAVVEIDVVTVLVCVEVCELVLQSSVHMYGHSSATGINRWGSVDLQRP